MLCINLILSLNFAVTDQGVRILWWKCTMLLTALVPGLACFYNTFSCTVWLILPYWHFFLPSIPQILLRLQSVGIRHYQDLVLDKCPNQVDF